MKKEVGRYVLAVHRPIASKPATRVSVAAGRIFPIVGRDSHLSRLPDASRRFAKPPERLKIPEARA